MSIAIDTEKCIGCGRCAAVCPGGLIKKSENKTCFIKYPKDCWGCAACIKECPYGAVSLYLGADLGGTGGRMHVTREGDAVCWHMQRTDGTEEVITLNPKEANKY